jgi:primosomal protein N' (replication factor Y)
MPEDAHYAEILLPLHIPGTYTYRVPDALVAALQIGIRVVVPLGRNRLVAGLIWSMHRNPPEKGTARDILDVLDDQPVVDERMRKFWEWMSSYYLCYLGDVMQAALPSAMRISSETRFARDPDFDAVAFHQVYQSSSDEALLLRSLMSLEADENSKGEISKGGNPGTEESGTENPGMENPGMEDPGTEGSGAKNATGEGKSHAVWADARHSMAQAQIQQLFGRKLVGGLLRRLVAQGHIRTVESLDHKYKEKRVRYYRLAEAYRHDESLRSLMQEVERRSPRQTDVLMAYLQESPARAWVARKQLVDHKKLPAHVLQNLVDKGILEVTTFRVDRVPVVVGRGEAYTLSDRQLQALKETEQAWLQRLPVLLYGWTGSGKTLLYVELIRRNLADGEQALYILPEIALTTQLLERLSRYLGTGIAMYHSRFSDSERAEIWQQVADGQARVVLGARSAVFLPFRKLGMVVVDEEHDASFKQEDPAPRYHGRDSALVLAASHGSRVILGSATPSMESWYLATTGKYHLVRLEERFGGIQLPQIHRVDLLAEKRNKTLKGELSGALCTAIQKRLDRQEQIILLQNRRGYVPYTECADCGWTPGCTDCDITLTFHKTRHRMACHYCGFQAIPAPACPACGSIQLKTRGFGTEKIEEEVLQVFPNIRLARLDQDVARKKHAYADILGRFEAGQLDLLVGTQMVAKGLDFERVTLVGVLNADSGLKIPDFRAQERTFQLLSQVSGRSGRRRVRGEVLIQSRQPRHPLFQLIQDHNYSGFIEAELGNRSTHGYPPFVRLIRLSIRHRQEATASRAALWLANELRRLLGPRVTGPSVPTIARVRNEYHRELLLKIERAGPDLAKVKRNVMDAVTALEESSLGHQCRIWLDVDPA